MIDNSLKILRKSFDKYSDIAYKYAPINYQHVDQNNILRDMISAVNFDGDWDTSNSREHLKKFDLIPVAYYTVSETSTHYFILYCFYHPDDRDHENDLEGCLVFVDKEKNMIQGMITIAHWNFYSYSFDKQLKNGKETIDGKLYLEKFNGNFHPMTRQEPQKHGFYAWRGAPWWMILEPRDSKNSFGIRYVPKNEASQQRENAVKKFKETQFSYILIDFEDVEGLWTERNNSKLFSSWGTLNSSTRGSAHAPWVWDDFDDSSQTGTIFFDPAKIVRKYFSGFTKFDNHYLKKISR